MYTDVITKVILTAFVSGFLSIVYKIYLEVRNCRTAIIEILRYNLVRGHTNAIKEGEVSFRDFEALSKIYDIYSNLGGNGVGKESYRIIVDYYKKGAFHHEEN